MAAPSHYIRTIHTSFTAAHPNPWASSARSSTSNPTHSNLLLPSAHINSSSSSSAHHNNNPNNTTTHQKLSTFASNNNPHPNSATLSSNAAQIQALGRTHGMPPSTGAGGRRRAYAFRSLSPSPVTLLAGGTIGSSEGLSSSTAKSTTTTTTPTPTTTTPTTSSYKFDPFAPDLDEPTSVVPSISLQPNSPIMGHAAVFNNDSESGYHSLDSSHHQHRHGQQYYPNTHSVRGQQNPPQGGYHQNNQGPLYSSSMSSRSPSPSSSRTTRGINLSTTLQHHRGGPYTMYFSPSASTEVVRKSSSSYPVRRGTYLSSADVDSFASAAGSGGGGRTNLNNNNNTANHVVHHHYQTRGRSLSPPTSSGTRVSASSSHGSSRSLTHPSSSTTPIAAVAAVSTGSPTSNTSNTSNTTTTSTSTTTPNLPNRPYDREAKSRLVAGILFNRAQFGGSGGVNGISSKMRQQQQRRRMGYCYYMDGRGGKVYEKSGLSIVCAVGGGEV